MFPFWRLCHRRPEGRQICKTGWATEVSNVKRNYTAATAAVLLTEVLPNLAMAQEPLTIPPAATSQLAAISLASLPYTAAATALALAFLIIFNQKLQREVRERKQVEKRLRDSEREKAVVLDSIAEQVIYLDTDQRLIWANQAVRSQCKAFSGTHLGRYCYEIWGGKRQPCDGCPVKLTLTDGNSHKNEIEDADGHSWLIQAYPVTTEGDGLDGVVVISSDITENRHLQEEILKTRKLESVGVLAGGIAHDFNNMLTAVMGYISLTELKQTNDNGSRPYLNKAMEAAMRAKQLASRLLTFSQGGHPIRRQVAVAPLLAQAGDNTTKGHPVGIRLEVAPECQLLHCDKAQLLQAVENVIINARENTPRGGEILVRADCTQIEKGIGEVVLPGGYLRISVCDRGPGIPKKIVDKIFDPYFTTKPMGAEKGSGLGLAITHSIVQKHQGYASVEARSGGGTAVHLFLPLDIADPKKTQAALAPKTDEPNQGGERILVLEDETLVWEVAEMLLSHLGYQVSHAPHGEAAVALYKEAQASDKPFGTVILDLTIKGGMGGRKTLEALKRIDPSVRAFVSSGYNSDPVLTDYQRYGFSGVIPKPYTLDEVKRALAHRPKPPDIVSN
jgi:two-component system, cell cycle sensor histidine kinase and response regulator CckA